MPLILPPLAIFFWPLAAAARFISFAFEFHKVIAEAFLAVTMRPAFRRFANIDISLGGHFPAAGVAEEEGLFE